MTGLLIGIAEFSPVLFCVLLFLNALSLVAIGMGIFVGRIWRTAAAIGLIFVISEVGCGLYLQAKARHKAGLAAQSDFAPQARFAQYLC